MAKNEYSLIVLGAGGTGTYFLKEVSRLIASDASIKRHIVSMTICDGDIVEEKNLSRQCFCIDDIGRKKAIVMAEVLNDAFSLDWKAYPEYVLSVSDLERFVQSGSIPLIIGCVDNHAARLLVETFFEKRANCIVFDSANEYEAGELVIAAKMNGMVMGPCRSFYFPDIKTGDVRTVSEMSCEELNNVAPQHIFTNMCAGMHLCVAFHNLMYEKLDTGVSFFNPLKMQDSFMSYGG